MSDTYMLTRHVSAVAALLMGRCHERTSQLVVGAADGQRPSLTNWFPAHRPLEYTVGGLWSAPIGGRIFCAIEIRLDPSEQAMTDELRYVTPLVTRYASDEMGVLFGARPGGF